jgi:beta-lactamase class A
VPVFTPSPTPSPTPIVTRSSDPLSPVVLPLDALSPQAGDLARSSGLASFSAIVLIPGEGVAYQFNGDKASPLMSVAKIPIMLTLMDKAIDEKRELTPYENALLGKMIRQSDNNAADAIWSIIGASTGMNRFLESVGLPALVSHEERWGETLASPMHTSMLVGMLIDGRILNEPMRGKAMTLLGDIDPSQDWGALAGLTVSAQTGIKNGWFPESYGWVLNSTAFVLPSDSPAYVIAVFTTGARRYYDGVALIEQFATAVNSAMAQRR